MVYHILIPVCGCVEYVVDADSEEDAKELVLEGFGDFHYSDEMVEDTDSNNWEIYHD